MQKDTYASTAYQAPTVEDINKPGPIPPELMERMKAKAVELRKKFPHMKPERIKRKVAEYFKVKLV